jgi:hypothetical protein
MGKGNITTSEFLCRHLLPLLSQPGNRSGKHHLQTVRFARIKTGRYRCEGPADLVTLAEVMLFAPTGISG